MTKAFDDVIAERKRQIDVEGWSHEHDDAHSLGELAAAGAAYAIRDRADSNPPTFWPWDWRWWKPKDRRRNLVRAAALIVAEIERLDRKA
jgi:hypothetical protein